MCFQYDHPDQEVGTHARKLAMRGLIKTTTILLVFGCTSLFLIASAVSDRDSDVATRIRSLEALRFEAQQQRNLAALDALFDEGVMWVDANGVLSTKAGYLETLHDSSSGRIRVESMTIKVSGQMAIVVGIYNQSGIKNNRPYRQRCRFIDTWTFKRDKWVLIAATATSTIA